MSRPRWQRDVCGLLAALALLGCTDDPRATKPAHDAGRDAGAPDARVPRQVDDAGLDAAADAGDGAVIDDDEGDAGVLPDASAEPDVSTSDTPRGRLSLVDQGAWLAVAGEEDPWSDRPDDASCQPEGHGHEIFGDEDGYFVNTAKCSYATLSQRSLAEVRAGDEIAVRVWHFELLGPAGAQAHVALRVGELDLLDETIALPAQSALLSRRVMAPEAIPANTPVMLHVHNHGANEYYLLEVSTGPAEP